MSNDKKREHAALMWRVSMTILLVGYLAGFVLLGLAGALSWWVAVPFVVICAILTYLVFTVRFE